MPVSRIRPPLATTLLSRPALAALVVAVAPALAVAQAADTGPARPDPLDAAAGVPDAQYRSAFAGYRGLADEPVGSWEAANEVVERAGGWKAYAREAAEPEAQSANGASAGPAGHARRNRQ
ncbi:MAG TPA: hypothetical protein VK052_00420 [Zeimonas sp.]|nr:hypothetical protein [Zeimonas sp.]